MISVAVPVEKIAEVLGPRGPIANVRANWPLVEAALARHEILTEACAIAAIATIGIETGCFSPIKERGGPAYFTKLYEENKDEAERLGNTQPGDGARFRGRGFVQITGRSNYTRYGHAISVDLAGNPDLALDPKIAAEVLALYFRDHSIQNAAAAGNWELVRRRVNGGLNGWADFKKYVDGLQAAAKALAATPAQGAYA
jgi:Chitinase class I